MPDCEYCGRSFEDEDAYLDHLEAVHEGELGAIDRRRLDARTSDEGGGLGAGLPAVAGVGVLLLAGAGLLFVWGGLPGDSGAPSDGIETRPLPDSGDDALLGDVTTHEDLSRTHVSPGTDVEYETTPPVGGPHYGSTVDPGFYESERRAGELVHNLEHGHVVVYYDPGALDSDARESLEAFAGAHTDGFAAVVVVPNPAEDPESAFVLTAWGHMLRMDDYDARTVRAFLAEYLGRGPEHPVR